MKPTPPLLRLGALALDIEQAALLLGVLQGRHDHAPPYKLARRALAAWFTPEQWRRRSFELVKPHHWHKHRAALLAKGLVTQVTVTLDNGSETVGAQLTDLGEAIARAIQAAMPPALTGQEYARFIEARRGLEAAARSFAR